MEKAATRSLTFTENDVALPAERGNLEYAGLALVYEGNRVKSALLGRDLNPLGRGDGAHYATGAFTISQATAPLFPDSPESGNSVNNDDQSGSNDQGQALDATTLECIAQVKPVPCATCVTIVKPCKDCCNLTDVTKTSRSKWCSCLKKAICNTMPCNVGDNDCCKAITTSCSCICGSLVKCVSGASCGKSKDSSNNGPTTQPPTAKMPAPPQPGASTFGMLSTWSDWAKWIGLAVPFLICIMMAILGHIPNPFQFCLTGARLVTGLGSAAVKLEVILCELGGCCDDRQGCMKCCFRNYYLDYAACLGNIAIGMSGSLMEAGGVGFAGPTPIPGWQIGGPFCVQMARDKLNACMADCNDCLENI